MSGVLVPEERATELVERLTREGLESFRDDVRAGRRDTGLKSLDERGAMSEIVRDQYTGRYPLELIQNANDAEASDGLTDGQVKFVVTENALLVADQGVGFGVDEVNAICGFARSSKDPRKNIGHKGLGFKSVREITDRPQIISAGVRFGFDAERLRREIEMIAGEVPQGQRLPDYAFPFALTDQDLGVDLDAVDRLLSEGFRTVMRLPFREPGLRETVARHVEETVTPRLLLFLDATGSLEVVGAARNSLARVLREDHEGHEYLILESDGAPEEYLVFRRQLKIPERRLVEGLGPVWQDVEAVRAIVAVPLGRDGPRGGVPEPIHVYFPTEEETGFSLAVHADFQTDLDRRRISKATHTMEYNEWLRGELVEFVADGVVPWLSKHYSGTAVLSAFARYGTPTGDGATLRRALLQRLCDAYWVPCRNGLNRPQSARLLPSTVPDRAALHSWLQAERPYVVPAAEEVPEVREMLVNELRVPQVDTTTLLADLEPPHDDVQVEKYYGLLVDWSKRQAGFASALKGAKCVRLRDGTWVRPVDPSFLPRQRSEEDFPPELNIPIVDIPDIKGLGDLLEGAGVKPLSWRTVVADFLMPLLTDIEADSAGRRETALAALRAYYDLRGAASDQSIRQAVQDVMLPVRVPAGADDWSQGPEVRDQEFRKASQLYFGRDWLPDSQLETVYGPFHGQDFLDVAAPHDPDELAASRAFYEWLGVLDRPRVVLTSDPNSTPTEWRNSKEFNSTVKDPQGHPYSQVLSDPQLDRVHTLIRRADRARLIALWHELAKHWTEYSSRVGSATWRCIASAHKGERDRELQSSTAFVLRNMACIPVLRDGQASLAPAKDVWRPSSDTPSRVRRLLRVVDPAVGPTSVAMAEWLGFVDGARANSSDLIGLLQELAHVVGSNEELSEDDVEAALWLSRRLDQAWASDDDSRDAGEVPLLAEQGGYRRLVARPYLVNDPLLAESWSDLVAIYRGDRDLHALLGGLGLRVLDDEVQVTAVPGILDPDAAERVCDRLADTSSAIVALAARDVPSRVDEIAARLHNLVVICTPELSLEYRFEPHEPRRQSDAKVYFSADSTVHLRVEGGEPDWPTLGLRLADYLNVRLGDAIAALLITADPAIDPKIRESFLDAHRIRDEDLRRAGEALRDASLAQPEVVAEVLRTDEILIGVASGDGEVEEPTSPVTRLRPAAPTTLRDLPEPTVGPSGALNEVVAPTGAGSTEARGEDQSGTTVDGAGSIDQRSSSVRAALHREPRRGAAPNAHDDSRFYSYVVATGSRESRMAARAEAEAMRTGGHGVERVVEYEAAAGRVAVPQEHNNKGFDVISESLSGLGRRIIEVKATSGAWPQRGIPVSRSQVERNIEAGDSFWLYVVEFAEDLERATVIPIQNPVASADYYVFDPGWRNLAGDRSE